MTDTQNSTSLDAPGTDSAQSRPKGIVTKNDSKTRIQLPYEVFTRSTLSADGRTHNFFTDIGAIHEGQEVIIWSYGDHTEVSDTGTVQRADRSGNKWFVQTKVRTPNQDTLTEGVSNLLHT